MLEFRRKCPSKTRRLAAAALSGLAAVGALAYCVTDQSSFRRRVPAAAPAPAPRAPRLLYWYGEIGDGSRALDAFAGRGPWRVPRDVSDAKTTFVFDDPVNADRVEVSSCDERPFEDAFEARFNFDQGGAKAEGGKLVAVLPRPRDAGGPLRTITLLAKGRGGACVSSIRLFDGVRAVEIAQIDERAAEVAPAAADALFDYRPETAARLTGPVRITFPVERRIDRVEAWNGDQISASAYAEGGRVKTLALEGDDGYRETVALADDMAPQSAALRVPFHGKELRIVVDAPYANRRGSQAAMSELRFFDGETEWRPAIEKSVAAREAATKAAFVKMRLGRALDRALGQDLDGDLWLFALRADGTFYLRGFDDNLSNARSYVALGRFEILPVAGKSGALDLRLRGFRRSSNAAIDGDFCGARCVDRAASAMSETPFLENLRVENFESSALVKVRNLAKRKARTLSFDTLKLGFVDVAD